VDGTAVHRAVGVELPAALLYALLRLRVDVFVVEQRCAYPELDGRDLEAGAVHLWAGPRAAPLACLRLLAEPGGVRRIGRLCTAPRARGRGLGRVLMAAALDEVGDAPCVLDAQEHLVGFYAAFGFTPCGRGYDWDGVPHVPMRRDE
jgi:ElaA protein